MKKSKKVVLFIVEGTTDETSLGLILSKLIEDKNIVKFKILRTDITSLHGIYPENIKKELAKQIKDFISSDIYTKKDILKVVHLVDLDGTFIDDKYINYKDGDIKYSSENICAHNVEQIKNRNKMKSDNLNVLISTDYLYKDIPYNVYFFSCNLEHVLHNEQNIPRKQKEFYAFKFAEKYSKHIYSFKKFINDSSFAISGNYMDTWNFIKINNNSLNRYSNFHLFVNSIN